MSRIEAPSLHGGFLYPAARSLRHSTGLGTSVYCFHSAGVPGPRGDCKFEPSPHEKAGRWLQTLEGDS